MGINSVQPFANYDNNDDFNYIPSPCPFTKGMSPSGIGEVLVMVALVRLKEFRFNAQSFWDLGTTRRN